jgi:hypothetical protein
MKIVEVIPHLCRKTCTVLQEIGQKHEQSLPFSKRLFFPGKRLVKRNISEYRGEVQAKEKEDGGEFPMKAAILVLLGFGFLLLIASRFLGGIPVLLIGLAMIAGGLFLGFRPGGILRKERAIDNWSVLVDEACMADGRERADTFYKDIATFLDASEAPNLKVERQHLAPSLARGLFGGQREFLVLTNATNYRLKPYQIYISARPYGINLACE